MMSGDRAETSLPARQKWKLSTQRSWSCSFPQVRVQRFIEEHQSLALALAELNVTVSLLQYYC